jgi:hypothetical protein
MYGGNIEIDSKADTFKYTIYKKKEVINLIDNYFSIHPLKTKLESRVSLIKQFYLITDSKNNTKKLK